MAHGIERRIEQTGLASAWKPEPGCSGLCGGLAPSILFLLVSWSWFIFTGCKMAILISKPLIQLQFENLGTGEESEIL